MLVSTVLVFIQTLLRRCGSKLKYKMWIKENY